jgi:hypothetical protein
MLKQDRKKAANGILYLYIYIYIVLAGTGRPMANQIKGGRQGRQARRNPRCEVVADPGATKTFARDAL